MAKRTVVALFNYGGGMRGLIPAHIMSQIERNTGLRMSDMVDIFTGPSTGSILNAALNVPHPQDPARPKYRASHLVKFYEREGIHIFPKDQYRAFRGFVHDFNNRTMKLGQLNSLFRHGHYDHGHLHRSLRALLGHTKLSETLKSIIIPTYNIDGEQIKATKEEDESIHAPAHTINNFVDEGGHAVWIKNIKFPNARNPLRTIKAELYDAVLASTAAPSFFPCHHFNAIDPITDHKISYSGIDGSIFDNPCMSYMGAIRQHLPKDVDLKMIILGTGYTNRSFNKDDWNRYGAMGIVDPVNDLPLINIFFNASESALHEAFAAEMQGSTYSFNKSILCDKQDKCPSTQIDDASESNIKRLKEFSYNIMEEKEKELDDVCELLVQNHDNNSRSSGGLSSFLFGK